MTIPVFLTGMIEKLKEWDPPMELNSWQRKVIKREADELLTGVMTLETLNKFFEIKWCNHENLLAEGTRQQEIEATFGPLFLKHAYLTVLSTKLGTKTMLKQGDRFMLAPEGYSGIGGRP